MESYDVMQRSNTSNNTNQGPEERCRINTFHTIEQDMKLTKYTNALFLFKAVIGGCIVWCKEGVPCVLVIYYYQILPITISSLKYTLPEEKKHSLSFH